MKSRSCKQKQMNTFGFDANKGITKIEYDLLGNPKKISFADRSYIDYVYSADGRRIKMQDFIMAHKPFR